MYGLYDDYIDSLYELEDILDIELEDWMLTYEDYKEMHHLIRRLRSLLFLNNY